MEIVEASSLRPAVLEEGFENTQEVPKRLAQPAESRRKRKRAFFLIRKNPGCAFVRVETVFVLTFTAERAGMMEPTDRNVETMSVGTR